MFKNDPEVNASEEPVQVVNKRPWVNTKPVPKWLFRRIPRPVPVVAMEPEPPRSERPVYVGWHSMIEADLIEGALRE